MQAVTEHQEPIYEQTGGMAISLEWVAYTVLTVLSLWLRVADLHSVPLSSDEAAQALAAWRALHPDLPGAALVPSSPLLFLLHGIGFTALGASEFSSRIFTALAGVLLVISPLLFRDLLGRGRAFAISLMLAFSPVLLVASRFDAPAVWSVLSALLMLWALWRWWASSQAAYAVAAVALLAVMVLLTDPAGFVLALILLGAGVITLVWNRFDEPDADPLPEVQARLRSWPWLAGLLAAVVVVFVVATAFGLYLPGLSSVGALLQQGISGILTPQVNAPPLFALLTALFYEPVLWLFALVGVWLAVRRGRLSLLDRFLAVWMVLAGFATLVYQGSGPEHALWLTLPMTALASTVVMRIFEVEDHPFLEVPAWAKPVTALLMVALLAIFAINFQGMTRALLSVPGANFMNAPFNLIHVVWTVIALLFIIVGIFLLSTVWGMGAALRGAGLGLLAFMLVTSLGSGWNAAVPNADNPVELWHTEPTARETFLLRDSLLELTRRQSGGFPYLRLYAQVEEDSVIAWLLRDFVRVNYITQPTEGRAQEVVLLPAMAEPPALGGSYVGQDFVTRRGWRMTGMEAFDFLPWWMQRRTRVPQLPVQTMVLWLRQDIYDGVDFKLNASG